MRTQKRPGRDEAGLLLDVSWRLLIVKTEEEKELLQKHHDSRARISGRNAVERLYPGSACLCVRHRCPNHFKIQADSASTPRNKSFPMSVFIRIPFGLYSVSLVISGQRFAILVVRTRSFYFAFLTRIPNHAANAASPRACHEHFFGKV